MLSLLRNENGLTGCRSPNTQELSVIRVNDREDNMTSALMCFYALKGPVTK